MFDYEKILLNKKIISKDFIPPELKGSGYEFLEDLFKSKLYKVYSEEDLLEELKSLRGVSNCSFKKEKFYISVGLDSYVITTNISLEFLKGFIITEFKIKEGSFMSRYLNSIKITITKPNYGKLVRIV